jgi:outer membrane usher protein FimD/PapC
VIAGGDVLATRSVADTVLVVKAEALAGSSIYIPPDREERIRFNNDGVGVLTSLPNYRRVELAFDESRLPLGYDLEKGDLNGSLRPYRGYIVKVPVVRQNPVRIYPKISSDAFGRGNAFSGDAFAPIEADGSIYFSTWPSPNLPLELTWQSENGSFSCRINMPPEPDKQSRSTSFDVHELRDVECNIERGE